MDFAGRDAPHRWEMGSGVWLREVHDGVNYITSSREYITILRYSSIMTHGPEDDDATRWQWHGNIDARARIRIGDPFYFFPLTTSLAA